jgi:rhodanese-related sulfurtransferase
MSFLSELFKTKTNVNHISATSLSQLLDSDADIKILDVRTPKEHKQSKILKSTNIDFFNSNFVSQCELKFNKEETILLYCRSGQRSSSAALKLEKAGFKSLYNLKGGMIAWSRL